MRQQTYLNVILTLNAILLGAMLWTQLAPMTRAADTTAAPATGGKLGIPNAAEQRLRMIETLRDIRTSVEATQRMIETGEVKVEITNLDNDGK